MLKLELGTNRQTFNKNFARWKNLRFSSSTNHYINLLAIITEKINGKK